jgi:hypothetical protein
MMKSNAECNPISIGNAKAAVGLGFRFEIASWTKDHLDQFDVPEITVDHYIYGSHEAKAVLRDLVGRVPLVAHGVGLSIGTDLLLDEAYLEKVAQTLVDLKMPSYSEHLAWTKALEVDLANLLPVPRTHQVANSLIEKIRFVQSYISVPFSLENISYVFDFSDSYLSDAEFFNLIFMETAIRRNNGSCSAIQKESNQTRKLERVYESHLARIQKHEWSKLKPLHFVVQRCVGQSVSIAESQEVLVPAIVVRPVASKVYDVRSGRK